MAQGRKAPPSNPPPGLGMAEMETGDGSSGLIAVAAVLVISQQHSRCVCNRARLYWVTPEVSRAFSELLVGGVKNE